MYNYNKFHTSVFYYLNTNALALQCFLLDNLRLATHRFHVHGDCIHGDFKLERHYQVTLMKCAQLFGTNIREKLARSETTMTILILGRYKYYNWALKAEPLLSHSQSPFRATSLSRREVTDAPETHQ